VVAPLPLGIVGGFGPALRRFVLVLHAQGQVTAERLTALLEGIGMAISSRKASRACLVSGVQRSLRPLPKHRTWPSASRRWTANHAR